MNKFTLGLLALALGSSAVMAQTSGATIITTDQIQAVLKAGANATDHTIRVLEMGDYQLAIAVVYRGRTAAGAASAGNATVAAAQTTGPRCGLTTPPAGQPAGQPGMISHSDTVETYIITSGSGTLVTGGQIVNGTPSAADSEVTRVLNGPSCSGRVYGATESKVMNVGDIAVIPAKVAHGWTAIGDHVTYLSVRPDPKRVLEKGYVYPALK